MRVVYLKLLNVAKGANKKELVMDFKRILEPLCSSHHFRDFVLLSASLLASIKNIHVNLHDVLTLDEDTDLLDLIISEYKKKFPGGLEHLFTLFSPFDELESGYHEIVSVYTHTKEKIDNIKAGYSSIDPEKDNNTKLIAAEFEKRLAEINDCISILENSCTNIYESLGKIDVYSFLPLQLGNLYSAIRKIDNKNQ